MGKISVTHSRSDRNKCVNDLFTLIFIYVFIFHSDSVTKTSTPSLSKNGKAAGQQGSPWETLVVFAINLKQLTVQMNMSNVMGNNT